MATWIGLLANMAILVPVVWIWSNARPHLLLFTSSQRETAFGLLLTAALVLVMNISVPFAEGIFIDLRGSVVTVAV